MGITFLRENFTAGYVDRKQNKVAAVIYIERGVRKNTLFTKNLFKIKHTEFFSCIFDFQNTKVLNNGISILFA